MAVDGKLGCCEGTSGTYPGMRPKARRVQLVEVFRGKTDQRLRERGNIQGSRQISFFAILQKKTGTTWEAPIAAGRGKALCRGVFFPESARELTGLIFVERGRSEEIVQADLALSSLGLLQGKGLQKKKKNAKKAPAVLRNFPK